MTKITMTAKDLDFTNVSSTYRGPARGCRCGCKGTYAHGALCDDGSPQSTRSVRMALNVIKHQNSFYPVPAEEGMFNDIIFDCIVGDRAITAYARTTEGHVAYKKWKAELKASQAADRARRNAQVDLATDEYMPA